METLIEKLKALLMPEPEIIGVHHVFNDGVRAAIKVVESEPPYGDWLTGNLELLKSLPVGQMLLVDPYGLSIDKKTIDVYKKVHQQDDPEKPYYVDQDGTFLYPFMIADSEFYRYQIICPIPTTKHGN